jgi:hypothetical protein
MKLLEEVAFWATAFVVVATGGAVLAYVTVAVIGLSAPLWPIVLAFIIAGAVSDYLYGRKMRAGKAPYLLPFYLRWRGWLEGYEETAGFTNRTYRDPRVHRVVPVTRLA